VADVLEKIGVPPKTAKVLGDLAGGTLPEREAVMAAMPNLKEVVETIPKDLLPKPLGDVIGPLAGIATGTPEEVQKELEALRKKAEEEAKKRIKEEINRLKDKLKERLVGKDKSKKPADPKPASKAEPIVESSNTTIIKNPVPGGSDTIRLRRRPDSGTDKPKPDAESPETQKFRQNRPPGDGGGSGSRG
jgi:hypothetical protein